MDQPNWEELSKTLSNEELQMMKDLYMKLFNIYQKEIESEQEV